MRFGGYAAEDESPFVQTSSDEVTSATLEGLLLQISVVTVYEM